MVERVTYSASRSQSSWPSAAAGSVWAQVTRAEAEQLELAPGQIVGPARATRASSRTAADRRRPS